MKAYRIYEFDEYGYDSSVEYSMKYSNAIISFNNKVKRIAREASEDLVVKEDFSEQVHQFRMEFSRKDAIEIISRKEPYILYKKGNKLIATLPYWGKTSYEYNEWDINSKVVVLEEIDLLD